MVGIDYESFMIESIVQDAVLRNLQLLAESDLLFVAIPFTGRS